jgi:hypothetical protein
VVVGQQKHALLGIDTSRTKRAAPAAARSFANRHYQFETVLLSLLRGRMRKAFAVWQEQPI